MKASDVQSHGNLAKQRKALDLSEGDHQGHNRRGGGVAETANKNLLNGDRYKVDFEAPA
jgi:hypothetical protein